MNDQRLEHEIRETLDDAAPPMPPDKLLHDFERKASSTRRRPRWLAHSTEPPMYYDRRLAVGSPQVRMVSIMAATLMLILSLAAVGAGIYNLLQDEIVVDQSGNGDYLTIQEAVEAAKDGTRIRVMPGTYREYLDIDKDVEIAGDGDRSGVLIDYTHDGQAGGDWGYGIRLDDVDAAIRNLEIRGPSDGTAIRAFGGSLDLEDVVVHPGPFSLWTTGSGLVRRVVSYGLILDGAHDLAIEDSELWCTVRVAGTSGVTFQGTAFRLDPNECVEEPANEQGDMSIASGARTAGRDGSSFVLGDPVAYPIAVQIESASPRITDSTFELPLLIRARLVERAAIGPRHELAVYADLPALGARPVVEGSRFTGLATAVSVFDSAMPEIRGNDFVDNETAIAVGVSNALLEDNLVSGGRTGFVLTAARPELHGNTVENVVGPAVSIVERAGPVLRDNVLCADGDALDIDETATPDIDDSNEICDGSAERLVVDSSGVGDFLTIQEALDAARDGNRIDVMPGTYTGYLDVTKDVSIRGVGNREDVVIDYTPEGGAESREFGLWFDEVVASLSNLEVRGPAVSTAIEVDGGRLDLENIRVQPGPESLNTTGGGSVNGVELHGPVRIGTDSTLAVEDSSLWCFVQVASSEATFSGSTFRFDEELCPRSPSRLGRHTAAPNGTLLPGESGDAVMIEAASPTFTDNTFELPMQVFGVTPDVWSENPDRIVRPGRIGAEPVIEGNTFRGLETAITVNQSARPQIRGNDFEDNGAAVEVGAALAIIEDNIVSSGGTGFVLTAANPELNRNTVEGVTGPAVAVTGSGSPILRDNVLCAIDDTMVIAETADPDIDASNQICDSSAQRLVVDASGNGDFTTIPEALDAIEDGGTILVMPGIYTGWFDVTKDVAIRGVGARGEIVIEYDHEGQVGVDDWGYGIRLTDVDASIENLLLRGPTDGTAIMARGGSLDLDNVIVQPGLTGLRSSASGSVRNVEFYGLILDGASDVRIEDSRFSCSVRVAGTSGVSFERATFFDSDACPDLRQASDGDETIPIDTDWPIGTRSALFDGIRIEAASPKIVDSVFEMPLEILGNLIPVETGPQRNELWVHFDPPPLGAAPVIENSTFDGLETAIAVVDSASPQIRNNTFTSNGLAVEVGLSNALLEGNVVSGGQSGFWLTRAKPQLTGNTVEGVAGPAVSITDTAAPVLRDNVLCSDGEVVSIADTADPDIDGSNEICE